MQRIIPATMLNAWERATQDPDPMVALKATKPLWQHLAQWQSTLVANALQNQLRMLDKQRTGDRKAWQQELRQRAKTVQNQFRSVGR